MVGYAMDIRNARNNLVRDRIDAGASPGYAQVYSGTRPQTGDPIGAAVLLGTLTFSQPCAPDSALGILTFGAIADDADADNAGEAQWVRVNDGDGVFVGDYSAGIEGSGADFEFVDVDIVQNQLIRAASGRIVEGNP